MTSQIQKLEDELAAAYSASADYIVRCVRAETRSEELAARIRELERQLAATCQREAATTKRSDERICALEAQIAARSLATIEAVPVAEVWRRAMEAAAQAADKAAAESARYYLRTDLRHYIDAANALHHFGGVIRALPLPDDLK